MKIFCFGVSHQTANVEVRERFVIPDSALADSLNRLAGIADVRIPNSISRRLSRISMDLPGLAISSISSDCLRSRQ
jgi:hypothetical protein